MLTKIKMNDLARPMYVDLKDINGIMDHQAGLTRFWIRGLPDSFVSSLSVGDLLKLVNEAQLYAGQRKETPVIPS